MKGFASEIFKNNVLDKRTAVVDQNGSRETTWEKLYEWSCRVAVYAGQQGMKGIVPVCMERSAEAAATILGLNLAGIGVAPMALSTPEARRQMISEQTGNVLWTMDTFAQALLCEPAKGLLDTEETMPKGEAAYVVFTSGSTGVPKGVLLNNRAITDAMIRDAGPEFFDFQKDSRVLQTGSLSFIAFVVDMLSPLYAGCTVHILPEEMKGDCEKITGYINRHAITELYMPPQLYRIFEGAPSLRCVYTGTDKIINLGPKGKCKLKSGYGSSETAGPFLSYDIKEPMKNTPIGKTCKEIKTYILDDKGELSDEGELYVSGSVALAYLNLPEKNKEAFLPNRFSDDPDFRVLFRTGDLVKRLEDGNLLFINRRDNMLKINGQRVEPGEIELAMMDFDGILLAVVKGFADEEGRSILCAYYTSSEPVDEAALKDFLSERLNPYMIPVVFVRLPEIPVNQNGKIDRKSLQKPDFAVYKKEYAAPENETEKTLCEGFSKTLHLEKVGAEDDFFALGGDSVAVMLLVKECAELGIRRDDVFAGRTPRGIAARFAESDRKNKIVRERKAAAECAPLTDSQMGVYLECIAAPDSTMYNLPVHFTMHRTGKMTAAYVQSCVDQVLRLHPALYACIDGDGEPVQMVRNAFPEQGICRAEESTEDAVKEALKTAIFPFELAAGPLCRAAAWLTEQTLHLFIDMHHLVSDGTSLSLLCRQLGDALSGHMSEAEETDAFALYELEEKHKSPEAVQAAREYFEGLLGGVETDSKLQPDFRSDRKGTLQAATLRIPLLLPELKDKLRLSGITENTFFMGAYGYALAKMTGQEESLFTAGESGRQDAAVQNTVGMMVRTLPVVMKFNEDGSGVEMLKALQEQFFRSMVQDCIFFGELCQNYGISSDVSFVYQGELLKAYESKEGKIRGEVLPIPHAKGSLSGSVLKTSEEGYLLQLEYRTDLYEEATIRTFADLYERIAVQLLDAEKMYEIKLTSKEEDALLEGFWGEASAYDTQETVLDMFRRNVEQYPEKIAVVYDGARYTYAQTDEISSRIACHLSKQGVEKGQTVSILVPRNEYTVLAALGVMKAGAVYEPLDPSYPTERLNFMCEDAETKLLIADPALVSLVSEYHGRVLLTDEIPGLPAVDAECLKALSHAAPEDVFVLLYTSGTTGKPKGCMVNHGNLRALLHDHRKRMEMDESCVVGTYASFGFDAHLLDFYTALANGGELHIIPDELRLDFPKLKDYCEGNGITHMIMTTQVARLFVMKYPYLRGMRYMGCGGEALISFPPPENYRFFNLYGPSECTVYTTGFAMDREYDPMPIGRANDNCHVFVADAYGRRVPAGVPGELIIAGPQVAAGYRNRPEKTAEVFVPNTYEKNPEEMYRNCYKTGDIVRFMRDGNLQYIGRRDLQVKIRGFRIELSEVEKVMLDYPGITEAVVIAVEGSGGKNLHGYVVSPEAAVDFAELSRFIGERKPAYMIPAAMMQLESLPLTPNHKVDKRKLPPIKGKAAQETGTARAMTRLEEELAAMVQEITGNEGFGVETTFSAAGITSISSIQLATRIYKRFGLHITVNDILDGGTILSVENAIIEYLWERSMEAAQGKNSDLPKPVLRHYPLTQTQMGVYLDSLRTGMDAYNIPILYRLPKALDRERLKAAVETAVRNHPSMMCYIYPDENGDVAMYPQPEMEITVTEEQFEGLISEAAAKGTTQQSRMPEPTRFAFTNAPLFRFRILHSGEEDYLFAEVHHIISDGTSMQILMQDIDLAYQGEQPEFEPYTSYDLALEEQGMRSKEEHVDLRSRKDASSEEGKRSGSRDLTAAKDYYDSVFRGVSADYLPGADRDGAVQFAALDAAVTANAEQVRACCEKYGVTENILFTAAFGILLGKYTAHEDALFATIYNGRTDPRAERLVGMLVKTLPLYVQNDAEATVADYLHSLEVLLQMLKKFDLYSFADAVRDYGVSADVLFAYQGSMAVPAEIDGMLMESIPLEPEQPKAELSAEVYAEKDVYRLHLEYNAGRYSEVWMESFADAYNTCLSNLMQAEKIGDIEILSEKAFHRFDTFNDTAWEVPYRPAYRLIEEQTAAHPEKTAVVDCSSSITYRQLDNMTNELGRRLMALGIRPDDVAGIMTDRRKDIYIAEIGVLKSGGAFLYLSPDYPDERIRYIASDCRLKAIVTTRSMAERKQALFEELGLALLYTDDIDENITSSGTDVSVEPDRVAYLIYTSGSTGKPKGVMVTQKNLLNLADANPKNHMLTAYQSEVSAAVSAFTFDASILDGFITLANGTTVCIASETEIHDPNAFAEMCLKNHVTGFISTASFTLSMLDAPAFADVVKQLKCMIAGGETFPRALYEKLRDLNPVMNIINGYGPSETCVSCTAKVLTSSEHITIGTPLNNYRLFIVDKQNHILPMGALGELTILGDGVGRGYVNRDDLTAKAFFRLLGEPAYKSGDLSLITHDGEVEFHGRIDNQVKLRGLRIELGEIEAAINACDGVKSSIVIVSGGERNPFLAAYFTAEYPKDTKELMQEISQTLTEYMVPRVMIQLEAMPLTANGKIDKKALPEPVLQSAESVYVPPTNETERLLCEAFEKTFGMERIGIDDDFFALGGTSLMATKVAMFAFARNLPIVYKDIFDHPTVRSLSRLAEAAVVAPSGERTTERAAASGTDAEYRGKEVPAASPMPSTEPDGSSDGREERIAAALSGNTWQPGDDAGHRPLGNLLLTGATGFLGMHVLRHFLEHEEGEVYCLLRKGHFTSLKLKLMSVYFYYFNESIEDLMDQRVHCIDGDITDAEAMDKLAVLPFDTLMNCAACVKHFAHSDILERVNVRGVANLADLCFRTGKRLIHVSTTSVAGESVGGNPPRERKLQESDLDFGQLLENDYVVSKFKSEQLVLDAVGRGLDAKIFRAGNLMSRYSDGEFQMNYLTNGFMRRLRGYYALGCIPYSHLSTELEFSPIDETAAAMLELAKTDRRFTVFHANNVHKVFLSDVIRAMNRAGLSMECVEETEFAERLKSAMENPDKNDAAGALLTYLNRDRRDSRFLLGSTNDTTARVLNRIGFAWNITDDRYIIRSLLQLKGLGFFDFE